MNKLRTVKSKINKKFKNNRPNPEFIGSYKKEDVQNKLLFKCYLISRLE